MQFKNKLLFLGFFTILITITIISLGIFLIDKNNPAQNHNESVIGINSLIAKINSFSSDQSIIKNSQYKRALEKINYVSNINNPKDKRYTALRNAFSFWGSIYSETNNPNLRPVFEDFKNVAKANFPETYEEPLFSYPCQDLKCNNSPLPPKILNIIEEIKTSKIENYGKEFAVQDITNTGFMLEKTKEEKEAKALGYLIVVDIIRGNGAFTRTGMNNKIADEIRKFVEESYSEEFKKLNSTVNQ